MFIMDRGYFVIVICTYKVCRYQGGVFRWGFVIKYTVSCNFSKIIQYQYEAFRHSREGILLVTVVYQ